MVGLGLFTPNQSLERKQAQPAEPTTPEKHIRADRKTLTAWQQTMIARLIHPTRGVAPDKDTLSKAGNIQTDDLTFHQHGPDNNALFCKVTGNYLLVYG